MLTTLCRSSTPGTSSGSPESRVTSVRDRLNIIRQCVLRNEHFAPSTLPSRDREKLVTVGVIVCLARVWLVDGRDSWNQQNNYWDDLESDFCFLGCLHTTKKESYVWRMLMVLLNWIFQHWWAGFHTLPTNVIESASKRTNQVTVYSAKDALLSLKANTRRRRNWKLSPSANLPANLEPQRGKYIRNCEYSETYRWLKVNLWTYRFPREGCNIVIGRCEWIYRHQELPSLICYWIGTIRNPNTRRTPWIEFVLPVRCLAGPPANPGWDSEDVW